MNKGKEVCKRIKKQTKAAVLSKKDCHTSDQSREASEQC